ncbi:MAG: phosphotransferase [Jaaginema sp. PMC 1079.18]|nr:phosphotransferase [Jaaginema sp. PMC 1080.18]MEC4850505.1 phosphotransferase [Jaaginema sp. PMC 1079.18]MEC4864762.1 phosphotransferase [Jaaginema sp. PMC 1078.18]
MSSEVFPVVYSTLAVTAIASLVLENYALGEIVSCEFWHRGLCDIYLIQTPTAPYIFRVSHHHWRSHSDINFELELLDFWRQQNLPVAHPIPTKTQQFALEINAPEGKRYGTLFPYAPGEIAIGDFNTTQSLLLGKTLAQLHETSRKFQPSVSRQSLTLEYLFTDSWAVIKPFLKHRSEDIAYLEKAMNASREKIGDLPQSKPFWVICWGDPHSGNTHFTSDNQMTLFDFDQCGYGWRIFDIAKFWHVSLRTGISRKVRDTFLEGYQTIAPLSQPELALLQPFTQAAHFWSWSISIHNASVHNWCLLDDSYFNRRLEQFKRLSSKDWQLF